MFGTAEPRETVVSKLNALTGGTHTRFGIPFTTMDTLMTACDDLHRHGFQHMGREKMYSGVTGEPLDGLCFIGCVFCPGEPVRVWAHTCVSDVINDCDTW